MHSSQCDSSKAAADPCVPVWVCLCGTCMCVCGIVCKWYPENELRCQSLSSAMFGTGSDGCCVCQANWPVTFWEFSCPYFPSDLRIADDATTALRGLLEGSESCTHPWTTDTLPRQPTPWPCLGAFQYDVVAAVVLDSTSALPALWHFVYSEFALCITPYLDLTNF